MGDAGDAVRGGDFKLGFRLRVPRLCLRPRRPDLPALTPRSLRACQESRCCRSDRFLVATSLRASFFFF